MTPESLQAAVELHRPVGYDKFAYATDDPEAVVKYRCNECQQTVATAGCKTWRTANA